MMRRLLKWLTARLPVHPDGHLYQADRSLYMGRWILCDLPRFHARLHRIAAPDLDRDMHDHPASFLSAVLCGGYVEARPVTIDPCFEPIARPGGLQWENELRERAHLTARSAGSIAVRRATDRHKITSVLPDTWTLFIFIGGRHQWWGYYTPKGKVWWKDYLRGASTAQAPTPAVFRRRSRSVA